jgi:Flp pilus assembly protein TadB
MNEDILALFIPIIGIIMGVGAAIVGIVSRHRQQLQRVELRHKERVVAMERGLELPPELADADVRRPRYLLKGLVYSGVGIGLYFPLRAVAGDDESLFALIPLAVGVAYLIFYFVQGRHEEAAAASDNMPR